MRLTFVVTELVLEEDELAADVSNVVERLTIVSTELAVVDTEVDSEVEELAVVLDWLTEVLALLDVTSVVLLAALLVDVTVEFTVVSSVVRLVTVELIGVVKVRLTVVDTDPEVVVERLVYVV